LSPTYYLKINPLLFVFKPLLYTLLSFLQALLDINAVILLANQSATAPKSSNEEAHMTQQQQQRLASLWNTKGHLMRLVGLSSEGLACLKHASQLNPGNNKHNEDYMAAKTAYRDPSHK
jgi:hypothetical protein